MSLTRGLAVPAVGVVRWVHRRAIESQVRARRNAMVAATACAHRRAEREDVAAFLADRHDAEAAAEADDPLGAAEEQAASRRVTGR